jgi:hypothetical protein
MIESLILSFTTSKQGWAAVQRGSLVEKPAGDVDGWHDVVIEGYDFADHTVVCLNLWSSDSKKSTQTFKVKYSALHKFRTTIVSFDSHSIKGKTTREFIPTFQSSSGTLNGLPVQVCWVDEETAMCHPRFICEPELSRTDRLYFRGYNVDEYIAAQVRLPSSLLDWFMPEWSRVWAQQLRVK